MPSKRSLARNVPRTKPSLENLESRWVPSGMQPTSAEQLLLQELNLARAQPAAYGAGIGVDLSNVAPSAPLAFNPDLIEAAFLHSQDMSAQGYFAHNTPQGEDPGQRMAAAGFNWTGWGESIAGGTAYPGPASALAGLIADAGVPDIGHRIQLLAMQPAFQGQNEVGIGVVQGSNGPLVDYYTLDTASAAVSQAYLTGAVFHDGHGTGQYAIGAGIAGATLTVSGIGSVTTWNSGGYSIAVAPGTYTVTVSGAGLAAPISRSVTVGASNVEVNFSPEDDAYIQKLYRDDLGRGAAASEVAGWESILQGWGGPAAVAGGIDRSAEARTHLVDGWYLAYLGRPAQGGEEQGWVNDLLQGAPEDQVQSAILGSAEFFNRTSLLENRGSGNDRYIAALYAVVLDRGATSNEISGWAATLTPTNRSIVAEGFLQSSEYRADVVNSYYANLLHRSAPPSASEVAAWAFSPLDFTTIRIGFESSQEFFLN
jgi:uncharacterized protein YkwD